MNERQLANCLKKTADGDESEAAADQNRMVTADCSVLDALCENAVETKDHDVREALIDILKNNAEEAHKRFTAYAIQSPDPARRRSALVNLSLMECGTAKDAVLKGLQDPDRKVRMAAAMNAGLYVDKEVLAALEYFFSTHRLACVRNFARLIVSQFCQSKRSRMVLDVTCLEDALHSPSVPPV